jgi:hypothetical protein
MKSLPQAAASIPPDCSVIQDGIGEPLVAPYRANMSNWKRSAAVFACAFTIYLVFFGGHYVSGDNAQRIAWAKALIDCHCNDIAPYLPGVRLASRQNYCVWGIGQPLLHVPLILLTRLFKRVTGFPIEGPLNMLLYVFNAALGVALLYLLIVRQGVRRRAATAGALVIGVSSVWFAYSKVGYGEPIVANLIIAMFLLADDHPWFAGLLGGYALAIRMDAILWVGLTGLIVPKDWKKSWLPIALGTIPGLLLVAVSNYARTHSVFSSGEGIQFSTPLFVGLYGLLLSSGKSLFLFSPLMVLYPAATVKLWREPGRRRFVLWTVALLCAQLLLYAKWWDWSGDDAWGPRFLALSTMTCLAAVVASDYINSRWFVVLALLGVLVELPGVLIGPHESLMLVHLRHPMKLDSDTLARSPITFADMHFDPRYSQITTTWELLLFKLSDGELEASSSYISSFVPRLQPTDIKIDILWLHPYPRKEPGAGITKSRRFDHNRWLAD